MKLNGKVVRLEQLKQELHTAGIAGDFCTSGDELLTYNAAGDTVDVPATAAPVVAAHVVPREPAPPNFVALRQAVADAGTISTLKASVLAFFNAISPR